MRKSSVISHQLTSVDRRQGLLTAVNRRLTTAPGFTLIELMVVMVIITILVSIVISTAKYAQTKAAHSRTVAEMAAMETALERYKSANGTYPPYPAVSNLYISSIVVYEGLAGSQKQYMTFKPTQLQTNIPNNSNLIMDPFGRPYYYQYPGSSNTAGFDLWSSGPDNQPNTPDDIVNWRQQ